MTYIRTSLKAQLERVFFFFFELVFIVPADWAGQGCVLGNLECVMSPSQIVHGPGAA